MKRQRPETPPRWPALLAAAAALLLVAAVAWPASAQATRTRPPDQPSTSSAGGSSSGGSTAVRSSGGSSSRSSATRPQDRGRAERTRPPAGSGGGVTAVDDDARSRRYRGRRPFYGGGGHFHYDPWYWYPYRYSWWLGYYGYGAYGPYPYGYYGGPYGHYPRPYPARASRANGALDLDLKPGDTQIYVNGQLVGTADDFDGWPEYLWLEAGDYHFIFYREGRRPIVREYKLLPGVVIDVEDRLERGESPPVEELFPPPTERRDARLRQEAEQRRRAAAEAGEDWRRRRPPAAGDRYGERGSRDRDRDDAGHDGRDGDFGSLTLEVEPADASVYLDGKLIGTGADLARLRRGLTVDAGDHLLEVVRPGYEPTEREFSIEAGDALSLAIALEER